VYDVASENFSRGAKTVRANLPISANTRQYAPILISNNIDQYYWQIKNLKPRCSAHRRAFRFLSFDHLHHLSHRLRYQLRL